MSYESGNVHPLLDPTKKFRVGDKLKKTLAALAVLILSVFGVVAVQSPAQAVIGCPVGAYYQTIDSFRRVSVG